MERERKIIQGQINKLKKARKDAAGSRNIIRQLTEQIKALEIQLEKTKLFNGYMFDERGNTMFNKLTWYQDKAIQLHQMGSNKNPDKLSKNSNGHPYLPFNVNRRTFNLSEVKKHPGVYKMVRKEVAYLSLNKNKLIPALESIYDPTKRGTGGNNERFKAIKRLKENQGLMG
tara:strand:- start:208 stop:723 length:516 start_codon:yes stop_codon:yes gene_type:complete